MFWFLRSIVLVIATRVSRAIFIIWRPGTFGSTQTIPAVWQLTTVVVEQHNPQNCCPLISPISAVLGFTSHNINSLSLCTWKGIFNMGSYSTSLIHLPTEIGYTFTAITFSRLIILCLIHYTKLNMGTVTHQTFFNPILKFWYYLDSMGIGIYYQGHTGTIMYIMWTNEPLLADFI